MIAANRKRLFAAGFFAIFANGVGFAIRGGILGDWGRAFGFTKSELGEISGMGLVGFGLTIILFSTITERLGYARLMATAFVLHVLSAMVTLATTPLFHAYGKDAAYWTLYLGMFLFALANGTCEAAVNPMTADLYPGAKTHHLNILHAGWPGGLVTGALLGYALAGKVPWEVQSLLFLAPALIYGGLLFRQTFPAPEARSHGATLGVMFTVVILPGFLVLIALHAMVGYVELGTDSWISQITGAIMADPGKGLLLFVYTSMLMFVLRFFAGPIVHRISSLGLLAASGVIGAAGLTLLGGTVTTVGCIASVTVYALGKTFLWPTMLGVASEHYPRSGALGLGLLGGVGMISAGLLGSPGIGYQQDYYASQQLRATSEATYAKYAADSQKSFLFFPKIAGLDGAKVGTLLAKPDHERSPTERADAEQVAAANLHGGRMALKWTAVVPLTMAIGYLGLLLAFRRRKRQTPAVIQQPA